MAGQLSHQRISGPISWHLLQGSGNSSDPQRSLMSSHTSLVIVTAECGALTEVSRLWPRQDPRQTPIASSDMAAMKKWATWQVPFCCCLNLLHCHCISASVWQRYAPKQIEIWRRLIFSRNIRIPYSNSNQHYSSFLIFLSWFDILNNLVQVLRSLILHPSWLLLNSCGKNSDSSALLSRSSSNMTARIVNARVSLRAGAKYLKLEYVLIPSYVKRADLVCMKLSLGTWSCYIPVLFGSCSIDWHLAWREAVDVLFNTGWLLKSYSDRSQLILLEEIWNETLWRLQLCLLYIWTMSSARSCLQSGWIRKANCSDVGLWRDSDWFFLFGRKMCSKFYFEFTMQSLSTRLHDLSGKRSCRKCEICACPNINDDWDLLYSDWEKVLTSYSSSWLLLQESWLEIHFLRLIAGLAKLRKRKRARWQRFPAML